MARPSRYPLGLRQCGVHMVAEAMERGDCLSDFEAIRMISAKLEIKPAESLRRWVRQLEVDQGVQPGKTTQGLAEIR